MVKGMVAIKIMQASYVGGGSCPKCAQGKMGEVGSKNQYWAAYVRHERLFKVALTHFIPMFSFNISQNHQETSRFSLWFQKVLKMNIKKKWLRNISKWQKQPPEVFCCLRPATLLIRNSNTGVFLWNLQNF